MVPLIGYVDRFSARPGETVAVKVSSELGDPYRADFVRIIHGDANPGGPGLKFEEIPASFAGTYRSRSQPLHLGSCGLVLPNKPVAFPDPCTVVVRIQPWLLDHRRQTVLAVEHGPTLWVIAGGVGLTLRGRDHRLAAPMLKRRWYELRIIAEDGRIWLRQTALQRSWGVTDSGEAEFPGSLGSLDKIVFGAAPAAAPGPRDNSWGDFFNGRIEDPAILAGAWRTASPLEPEDANCVA